MAIKVMGQHGFHEPMLQDRLRDETLVAAKAAPVLWLPSDEQISALTPRKWAALLTSLRNELKTIELAKQGSWQDLGSDVDREIVFRVRAIQAEREARKIRLKYEELLGNGEHNLLHTYEQEREALHAEIQQLVEERNAKVARAVELDKRLAEAEKELEELRGSGAQPQQTLQIGFQEPEQIQALHIKVDDLREMVAQGQEEAAARAGYIVADLGHIHAMKEAVKHLQEEQNDHVVLVAAALREISAELHAPNPLVERLDSEVTFLRSVVERLMAK